MRLLRLLVLVVVAVAGSFLPPSTAAAVEGIVDRAAAIGDADVSAPTTAHWDRQLDHNAHTVGGSPARSADEVRLRPGDELFAPGFTAGSIRNVNPLGGTQNCVNCVIATDARLAGRPASALNSAGAQPISIIETHFGGTFKPVAGRAEIESILSSSGHGSRGIVFGARGADPGHVFNAVNQNGVIRFLDGQTGQAASFNGFSEFFFLPTS